MKLFKYHLHKRFTSRGTWLDINDVFFAHGLFLQGARSHTFEQLKNTFVQNMNYWNFSQAFYAYPISNAKNLELIKT